MDVRSRLSHEDVKRIELDLLLSFDAFARTHGLTYWLMYGTLIGAARHGGFIPWDDDIDVAMPVEDYYRMIDLVNAGAEISPTCRLLAHGVNDTVSCRTFGKVIDVRTHVVEHELRRIDGLREGVWVDIFPLCGCGEDEQATRELVKKYDFFDSMLRRSTFKLTKGETAISTLRRAIAYLPAVFGGYKRWLEKCDEIQRKMPGMFEGAKCIALADTKYQYPVAWFKRTEALMFEGHELSVPCCWDDVLSASYGDWRALPPEEQRVSNHDFDAYAVGVEIVSVS